MKKILFVFIFALSFFSVAKSQAASLVWNQDCTATTGCTAGMTAAQSLAVVQSYIYSAYLGTATVPTVLAPVTCTGTASPFTCSTPNYIPFVGTVITLTAKNQIGESPKSVPFPLFLPATPVNVRLQ